MGDNKAFNERDFATNTFGALFDAAKPVNMSPNNTGLTELPPAQKAFIWYPYDKSTEFPLLGTGGRTAMAGPVFYAADFKNAKRSFPAYYDGKLFIYEWMRGWVMTVTMDNEGNYVSMEHFMPSYKFSNPMDMEFSADGDLYMLEYGTGWFQGNDNARLVRIEYTEGNRKPDLRIAADRTKAGVPMKVKLSAKGTKDFDHDDMEYTWKISSQDGTTLATLQKPDTSYTFDKPGIYTANLSVTDSEGQTSASSLEIQAGNEPPVVSFEIVKGNTMFFFPNQSFEYEASVTDKEDGSLNKGISPEQISVSASHLKEGFDKVEVVQGHLAADASALVAKGKKLMDKSDCKSCHLTDKKSIGPSYKQVAEKYKGDKTAANKLANKVINGGTGVWGEIAMAAHPQLSVGDASEIVNYILSLGEESPSLPAKGTYQPKIGEEDSNRGILILRAAYTDKGANNVPASASEEILVLKNPNLSVDDINKTTGTRKFRSNSPPVSLLQISQHNSNIGFDKIDMTNVDQLVVTYMAQARRNAVGGFIEAHLDSAAGPLLGETRIVVTQKEDPNASWFNPKFAKFKIKPAAGMHDIYLVFKNDKLKENQSLFIVLNIQLGSAENRK